MSIYFSYLKKYRLSFFIAVSCVFFEAFCDLLGPTMMARIINSGIQQDNLNNVFKYGIIMLVITVVGASVAIIRSILASTISQKVGVDLRNDLFFKILNFSESSSDALSGGTLITRMTNDTNQVVQFINGMMRIFLKSPLTCIGSIILASLLNLKLSIIIYAVVSVVATLIFISLKTSYPRFFKLQQSMDKLNSIIQEYLVGIRLIKAFGTYDEEAEKFNSANEDIMQKSISAQVIITFISPLLTLAVGIASVLAIYFGSKLFALGEIQPGDISAFTIYMSQMLMSLLMITNVFNIFVRTQASAQRINEVFAGEEDFLSTGLKPKLKGDIELINVSFSYPKGSGLAALDNLSFKINAGEKLAIIGPTGSGKSTLVWLLLRFYNPNEGTILLDKHPVEKLDVSRLRDSIALAPQKAALFSGSVLENLTWGNKKATKKDIEQAIKIAQAGFIYDMENSWDSYLSSGSVNISGGQKQRISLVRALLKNSPILILDDVTSALDSLTEAKVRNALLKKKDQTLVLITQKCTTAMFADKILVLEDGQAQGFGTHKELMASCAIYQAIYQSQITSDINGANNE